MTTFAIIVGAVALAAAVFVIHRRVKRDTVQAEPPATPGSGADPRNDPTHEQAR